MLALWVATVEPYSKGVSPCLRLRAAYVPFFTWAKTGFFYSKAFCVVFVRAFRFFPKSLRVGRFIVLVSPDNSLQELLKMYP